MLSVYVDDFKMAGKKENIPKAWKAIREARVESDKVEPFSNYLGAWSNTNNIVTPRGSGSRSVL